MEKKVRANPRGWKIAGSSRERRSCAGTVRCSAAWRVGGEGLRARGPGMLAMMAQIIMAMTTK